MVQIVAVNIADAMERQNMTPASLARAAEINPTGVYDILSGKSRSPRLDTLSKIASALNMPVFQLLEQDADRELRSEIVSLFAQLPPEERRRLIQAAEAWLPAKTA